MKGIAKGIADAWDSLIGNTENLADKLPDAIKKKLKIASPSRVMMEIGAFIPAGLSKGIEDNADDPQSAMRDLVQPPTVTLGGMARGAQAAGARSVRVESPQVVVTIQGDAGKLTKEDIEAAVRRAMDSLVEQLNLEGGAAMAR